MRLLAILLTIFLFSCSPKFRIQSDTPNPGDFSDYNSYKFYNPANIPASNFSFEESDKKVIFDAIAEEMKRHGYKSIQQADLMIKVQGGTKSTLEIQNDNLYPYNYNAYNYGRYDNYNNYYDRPRDQSKKETIIIIDIIDVKSDKIVWQGVGIGSLGKNETLTADAIHEAIAGIFMQYPYTASGSK